jgi:hypothetical protein
LGLARALADAAAIGVGGPSRRQMKKLPKEEEGLYAKILDRLTIVIQHREFYVKYLA